MYEGGRMPEIAEVETVRNTLKKRILHKKIVDFKVFYTPILLDDENYFKENLIGKEFIDIKRIGKWLLFETETHYLLSHLRMEGKYYLKQEDDIIEKHEHVEFVFEDGSDMRYHDTRKFGRMKIVLKEHLYEFEGIKVLKMNFTELRKILQKRKYKSILVHFFDNLYANVFDACDLSETNLFFGFMAQKPYIGIG